MSAALSINEIFYSIQGESTWAGRPCVFIRLMGCHLRCHYCDTEYAFHEGAKMTIDQVIAEARRLGGDCPLVEVTGGEPLLQPGVHPLMARLADAGKTVLLETSGACDITPCDPRVIRILDLKTPASGEADRNHWPNLDALRPADEIKFVICDRDDYQWAKAVMQQHSLASRAKAVLMSAVGEMAPGLELAGSVRLPLEDLAAWILEDHLPVTLQTQLHKLIWSPTARGV